MTRLTKMQITRLTEQLDEKIKAYVEQKIPKKDKPKFEEKRDPFLDLQKDFVAEVLRKTSTNYSYHLNSLHNEHVLLLAPAVLNKK